MIKGLSSWACFGGSRMASEAKSETVAGSRGVAGIGEGRWSSGATVSRASVRRTGAGTGGGGVDSRTAGLARDGAGTWRLEGWRRGERASLYGTFRRSPGPLSHSSRINRVYIHLHTFQRSLLAHSFPDDPRHAPPIHSPLLSCLARP